MNKTINVYHNDDSDLLTIDHVDFSGHKIGKVVKTDEGYITGEAAVAKVGILTYVLKDGSVRKELVTKEVLSNQDSIDTLKMKPVTNQHPQEILLNSQTVKKRKVGFTGENIRMVGDHLVTSLTITDNDAVNSIERGSNELSPGYQVKLLLKPGRLDSGEEYDAIQQFRKYNHLATCDLARGGRDLRLNFDSMEYLYSAVRCDGFEINTRKLLNKGKGKKMPNICINGIDYATDSPEIVNHVSSLEGKVDTLTVNLKNANVEIDKGKAAKDSLQEKYDSVSKDIPGKVSEAVKQRLSIERVAGKVLKEDDLKKIDSFPDIDLQKKIILAKCENAKLDDKSEAYIAARFDQVVEDLPLEKKTDGTNNNNMSNQRQKVYNRDVDKNGKVIDGDKARTDMVSSIEDGWKQKIV